MVSAQMNSRFTLADRLIPGEGLLWEAARLISANILLALCAHIVLPLSWTPVPLTGQTFGVLLVAVLLGARRSGFVLICYLLEGAAGWPVFQPLGLPGAARLLGPTAGYLWAFPVAGYLTGWITERIADRAGWRGVLQLSSGVLAGHALILAGGFSWLVLVSGMDFLRASAAGVLPFLMDAVVKTALIVAATRGMERVRTSAS